jgi:TonB-dependent receptor
MAQGKLGREGWLSRTGFLGGVRWEKTENEATGWVRARTLSTPAQQTADPVGSAQRDYANNRREVDGSYTKSFPSIHAFHDITENLKARLSWSTSFGRPRFGNLTPAETPNEANRTVTINNPALLPQTAKNWDASLEYYFEPVGSLSVGWFHKTIDDFIVTGIDSGTIGTGTDNGFNGEYPGFTMLTSANAGTAIVQGWEFSYQQQFTFLPGLLKGFSGFVNYTILDTHGNFGGTTTLTTGQVAGFVPRTANASLTWRYRGFSTRLLINYASTFLQTYGGAATPSRNLYRIKRKLINLGFSYQLRPSLNVTLDIDNLTNVPQKRYRGIPDQMEYFNYPGTTITVGVNGRF